jgi:hypothetical protein
MDTKSEDGTNAVKGEEGIRSWTEMSDFPKVFKGMPLLLKRIIGIYFSQDLDLDWMNLERLRHIGSQNDIAAQIKGGTS